MEYYTNKITDNRFIEILKKYTTTPRNILSLTLDQIKTAQTEYDTKYGGPSKRELKKIRRSDYTQTLVDRLDLKIIKFEKTDDTDNAAQILSDYARGTKWCITDIETGDQYLTNAPIYLIYKTIKYEVDHHINQENFYNRPLRPGETNILDLDEMQPDEEGKLTTNKMLCHIDPTDEDRTQLATPLDINIRLKQKDIEEIEPYIPGIKIFQEEESEISDAEYEAQIAAALARPQPKPIPQEVEFDRAINWYTQQAQVIKNELPNTAKYYEALAAWIKGDTQTTQQIAEDPKIKNTKNANVLRKLLTLKPKGYVFSQIRHIEIEEGTDEEKKRKFIESNGRDRDI